MNTACLRTEPRLTGIEKSNRSRNAAVTDRATAPKCKMRSSHTSRCRLLIRSSRGYGLESAGRKDGRYVRHAAPALHYVADRLSHIPDLLLRHRGIQRQGHDSR